MTATLEEIGQEKQRVSDRLERVTAERDKLATQIGELETAERVLSRFDTTRSGAPAAAATPQRRRGRPPGQSQAQPRTARANAKTGSLSIADAALRAVEAHGNGIPAAEVMTYLSEKFGMQVRPNHLGIALQRLGRAGRLEKRDDRWYPPAASTTPEEAQSQYAGA